MRHTLFITFDLIREGEINKSLSIASILAYLKGDGELLERMAFHHLSFNMFSNEFQPNNLQDKLRHIDLGCYDFIAISAYIWNDYILNDLIKNLRQNNFRGSIILGGYQITYSNKHELVKLYPDVQVFISGYAEESLLKLFKSCDAIDEPVFLNEPVAFENIPSVYLSNEIEVPFQSKMLRFETKRGCPYRCSFCAHRDLIKNKVYRHSLDKVFEEIFFFHQHEINRVNVLDPIFNVGNEYIQIMQEINRIGVKSKYVLQSRFENIIGETGRNYLNLCAEGNYHLEFGLQTADYNESMLINRKNNKHKISQVLEDIVDRDISFEVSLIYGLPGQTLDSFRRSIDFLKTKGCANIKAFPLMLLRGTELSAQKDQYSLTEESFDEFHIPLVTSSYSYTRKDWEAMKEIASQLNPVERI